jgi:hypothetical protein
MLIVPLIDLVLFFHCFGQPVRHEVIGVFNLDTGYAFPSDGENDTLPTLLSTEMLDIFQGFHDFGAH